jgi:hypothetical protein
MNTRPNKRMHLTSYCGLRPPPPAGDAGRWAAKDAHSNSKGRERVLWVKYSNIADYRDIGNVLTRYRESSTSIRAPS